LKNKAKTYFLLLGVLIIWSIIGFKIVATLNPDAPDLVQQDDTVLFDPQMIQETYAFSIRPSERDPFLGTLYVKKKTSTSTKKGKPKEEFVWVPILYQGMVSKQGSKEKIAVLSINGQQHIMKVGQEVNGVALIRVTNTEILVSYKGIKKTITKT